eukprot:15264903-Alexandrium_andersonii.AAC.1
MASHPSSASTGASPAAIRERTLPLRPYTPPVRVPVQQPGRPVLVGGEAQRLAFPTAGRHDRGHP